MPDVAVRILVFFVAMVICRSVAATHTVELPEFRIRVRADTETRAKTWRPFVERCQREVDRVTVSRQMPTKRLRIRFGSQSGDRGNLDIRFSAKESPIAITHRLVRAMLFRSTSGKRVEASSVPEWIAAAITHRLLFANRAILGRFEPDYQPARYGFNRGHFPQVAELVTRAVSPRDSIPYRLYAMHCDLLAAVVQESDELGECHIVELLEMAALGHSPHESLQTLFRSRFSEFGSLQRWYEQIVVDVSRKGRRTSARAEIVERISLLESIPMVVAGEKTARHTYVPVDEVPEKLKAYKGDPLGARKLQYEFYEVMKDAPRLMRPPILAYVKAFQKLEQGKLWRFKRAVRRARKELAEALEKQMALDDFLDRVEGETESGKQRFGAYTAVVRRFDRERRDLDPNLELYLDKLID
ncbi:MAG: hypothetical protein KAI66_10710 [Lentisphaeria bacterium]|nr:hypothetical protein [Lentisphaeria bacterium]